MGTNNNMKALILALFALGSHSALAQGGSCPDGFYPIGGQGASGCAPMPGHSGGGDYAEQPGPQPTWLKTWGAIAFSKTNTAVGLAIGERSKREAEEVALRDCRSAGGSDGCWVDMTYHNQCAAIAWGTNYGTAAGAGTKEIASELAVSACSKRTENCRVLYTACSEPILVF